MLSTDVATLNLFTFLFVTVLLTDDCLKGQYKRRTEKTRCSVNNALNECFNIMNSIPILDSNKSSTESASSENSNLPRGLVGMKGFPIAKGARLPSLRGPRDLTLGGTAKRIFTPNVSQCKERNKNNEASSTVAKPEKSGKNKRRTKEHVYRRSKNREFIQTQGIVFGEGPVGINTKPEFGYQLLSKGFSRSEKVLPKYVPKSKRNKNEDKEIQKFLRDDFIDDGDEDIDEKLFPTVLPISSKAEIFHQNFKKKWVRIAEQDEDGSLSDSSLGKGNKSFSINNASTTGQLPLNVFNMDGLPQSGKLLLFQFPDCLPGLKEKPDVTIKMDLPVESPGIPQKKKGTIKKKEATANSSVLSDWPEGYLGKLRIHKSGKSYLAVGSLILDINISTSIGFLQELVSVRIKNNTGDMTVLGHVNEKVVCVPSTEALIASCS